MRALTTLNPQPELLGWAVTPDVLNTAWGSSALLGAGGVCWGGQSCCWCSMLSVAAAEMGADDVASPDVQFDWARSRSMLGCGHWVEARGVPMNTHSTVCVCG